MSLFSLTSPGRRPVSLRPGYISHHLHILCSEYLYTWVKSTVTFCTALLLRILFLLDQSSKSDRYSGCIFSLYCHYVSFMAAALHCEVVHLQRNDTCSYPFLPTTLPLPFLRSQGLKSIRLRCPPPSWMSSLPCPYPSLLFSLLSRSSELHSLAAFS